ncbi:MAG: hypothetical protein ACOZQL_11080 [Myxococcota bacterium]
MTPLRRQLPLALLLGLAACGKDAPPPERLAPVDAGAPPAVKQPQAQLEAPQGAVTLEREGRATPAKAGPLFAGDVIDTGEDGAAVLRFEGDRVVELGPQGRFEVGVDGAGVMLTVTRGLVLTRVRATPQKEDGSVLVTIATPFGLTRVGAAELGLAVDDSAADVDVKLGEIELVSRSGEVTRVLAGKKATLGQARELPAIPLTIVATSTGKAELKAKDAKRFSPINPKRPPTLAAGDVVRVKEGRFSLTPDGSDTRIWLLQGAEAGVVDARRGVGRELTLLEVRKGELEIVAPSGQSTRVGVAPGVLLVSDLGGQFTVRKTGAGFELDAHTGDVRLEREGGEPLLVPGGSAATVPAKGAPSVRAPVPEVIALPSRAVRVFHAGLKRVALTWVEVEGVTEWRVQLATDPAFANLVRDGVVHEAFLNVPLPPKGAWYWRVFRGEAEHARGAASFGPEPRQSELSRARNVVPAGAETTSIFFQDKDKPPVVTFTWAALEGATRYEVKVYREGELASAVATRAVSATEVSLPENTLLEGRYLWSVTPYDAKGVALQGGRMNKLHMIFDNAVSALLIKTPRNGDAGGRTVRASGVAPVGSRLFINGRAASFDEQARFDTVVAPLPGGRLVFRLLHGGVESWTVRTVRAK